MYYRSASPRGKALIRADVGPAGGKESRLIALVDTGATVTGVSQSIVRGMELLPVDDRKHLVKTASGGVETRMYRANIRLIGNNNAKSDAHVMDIVGLPLAGREFDMLLGTDILSQCCLAYRGHEFFLGFDGSNEETLQAAADFFLPKKRGASRT